MNREIGSFIYKIRYPIFIVLFMWLVEALHYFFNINFTILGIYPRKITGLLGIFTAPYVHSNWGHLASNTLPILFLTTMMVVFYRRVAIQAYSLIMIGTGFMVWLLARESYHVGASGMVYGLVSFIFWTGFFKKNAKSVILALIVLTLYSGLFTNMFPNAEVHISWESHMYGAIVGLIAAFIMRNVIEDDEKQYLESPWANDTNIKQLFLPRDAFSKTKQQRYFEYMEAERIRIEQERIRRESLLN